MRSKTKETRAQQSRAKEKMYVVLQYFVSKVHKRYEYFAAVVTWPSTISDGEDRPDPEVVAAAEQSP